MSARQIINEIDPSELEQFFVQCLHRLPVGKVAQLLNEHLEDHEKGEIIDWFERVNASPIRTPRETRREGC